MQEFNSLQRLDFINYQLNKFANPLDWLKRLLAFLNDKESEFHSSNYKMYLEYLNIVNSGIEQLSNVITNTKKTSENSFDFVNQ